MPSLVPKWMKGPPMDPEKELAMFGCKMEEWVGFIEDSITYQIGGTTMIVISLLSDVQEMIERNQKEEARQMINRVKLLVQLTHDNMEDLQSEEKKDG